MSPRRRGPAQVAARRPTHQTFHIWLLEAGLLSLATWFGLQETRVFVPSLVHTLGQWASPTFVAIYGLATISLIWLTPLLWRWLGTFGAWVFPLGGLTLVRLLEQFNGSPLSDLTFSSVGVVCFVAVTLVASQHDLATGRGARGNPVWPWALGVGCILDVACRSLLLTVDLSWRRDLLGHGVTAALAALSFYLLVEWVRRWRGPEASHLEDPSLLTVLPWMGVPLFLLLHAVAFGQVSLLVTLGGLRFPWAAGWVVAGYLAALAVVWALLSRFGMDAQDWPVALMAGAVLILALSGIWRGGWLAAVLWLTGQVVAFLLLVLSAAAPLLPAGTGLKRWRATLALFLGWVAFVLLLFAYEAYNLQWALTLAAVGLAFCALWALRVVLPGQTVRVLRQRTWERGGVAAGFLLTVLVVGVTTLLLRPLDPVAAPSSETLGVMTYNIHQGFDAEGRPNLEAVARTVEAAGPDVLALNEVSRGQVMNGGVDALLWLAQRLGMAYEFGPNVGAVYGNALLSQYPIVGVRNFPFQAYTSEPRGCLVSTVQVGEQPVLFLVTHLDHQVEAAPARAAQVREVLDFWAGRRPAVLLGDLNAMPGSPELSYLKPAGWQDVAATLGPEPAATFPAASPIRRIDYIFVTPDLEPLTVQVPESLASDHRPVVARVGLGAIPAK